MAGLIRPGSERPAQSSVATTRNVASSSILAGSPCSPAVRSAHSTAIVRMSARRRESSPRTPPADPDRRAGAASPWRDGTPAAALVRAALKDRSSCSLQVPALALRLVPCQVGGSSADVAACERSYPDGLDARRATARVPTHPTVLRTRLQRVRTFRCGCRALTRPAPHQGRTASSPGARIAEREPPTWATPAGRVFGETLTTTAIRGAATRGSAEPCWPSADAQRQAMTAGGTSRSASVLFVTNCIDHRRHKWTI